MLLAQSKLLLVLDNVHTEESMEDLLAIDGEFAVVCTTRLRLTGLAGEDVEFVEIGPLPPQDAAQLAMSVAERLTAEECAELASVCGGLPIAVRIASARIRQSPQLCVSQYLGELANPDHGIDELRAGAKSVERILEDSYRLLEHEQTLLFTTLGLLPHTSVTVDVVTAALADDISKLATDHLRATGRLLDDLYQLNLIEQTGPDLFRLHDILYRFARRKASTDHHWRDRVVANTCLAYAVRADHAIRSIGFVDPNATVPSSGNLKAIDSLNQDYVGAVVMVESGTERQLWDKVITLAAAIIPALQHLGRWDELVRVSACLREAGEKTGNMEWQASGLLNLGTAAARKGDTDQAIDLYHRCFEVASAAGEVMAAELACNACGELLLGVGKPTDAIAMLRRGLRLWRLLEHALLLAQTLNSLGKANLAMTRWERAESYFRNALRVAQRGQIGGLLAGFGITLAEVLRLTGRVEAAEKECLTALERSRAVGDRETEADALRELALIQDTLDEDRPRLAALTSALEIYREVGDVRSQVSTLLLMGNAAEQQGDRREAMRHFADCAELAGRVNDLPHAANAMARIANLYGEAGKHDEADKYLRRATEIANHSGSDLLLLQVQHEQAHEVHPERWTGAYEGSGGRSE
ncbi:hypothetical protein KALB_5305 [Kutzneria albida DSM 43870]|uniref:Uncharacterized protein n=1 Tax=Kutzneria albida DSM 43870 TaxID=1449976 RepID=W5WCV8_9PSEU|nr:hypothetical protein KALB_5305 [Kutzneria albida DSM 43870]